MNFLIKIIIIKIKKKIKNQTKEHINGFLIPIKSPDKLAEKIEILANDATLREKMGIESRKIAEQKFSINYVISEHFAIYSSFKY